MAAESPQDFPSASASAPQPRHRYRLRFQKAGDLRHVSHIDLLHVFERLLRRADLPFASTQGFHPKPCLTFAQALALGVAGLNEAVDLELHTPLPADNLLERLNRHAPAGLSFLSARSREGKGSLQVRRAFYRLAAAVPCPDLAERCSAFLARARCLVERLRPQPRRLDIRPYLDQLSAESGALTMSLWVTPYGAARPEEVVRALGVGQTLDDGGILERTNLEIMDELPESERWLPDIPRLADVELPADEILAMANDAPGRSAAHGELLLPNPLSFET